MRRFIYLAGTLILFSVKLLAQTTDIADSVLIEEVRAYAKMKKYLAATKIDRLDESDLERAGAGGLEQLLWKNSSIYIKSDAGGLSTIRFRGTSPNQTSVIFGGLDVNSMTLGQSNLSNISSFLFDQVDLQYGSSSAVNGSGSVGGAIFLGLDSPWTQGLKIKSRVIEGSFGEQLYGAKVFAGKGKLESVSRIYYYNNRNDFKFKNSYTGNVEHPGAMKDRQHGASIENYGLIQELNYRFSRDEYIKSSLWLEHDWHQVQPNMPSNYSYHGGAEELLDRNIRFWSEYHNERKTFKYNAGLGYVHDMEIDDGNTQEKIGTNRLVASFEVREDLGKTFGYKAGMKYKYIKPKVYAYSSSVIDHEQHLDLYGSSFLHIRDRLKLTLNLRQTFVTNFSAPLTPSFGTEYRLHSGSKSSVLATGSIARSYRIPTFNDRYWGTQGNSDLKPEDGMNYEFGLNYHYITDNFKANLKLNAFYLDIKNWIEWRNLGEWTAKNVGEVVSKGLEIQSSARFKVGETGFDLRLGYTYNPVEAVRDVSESVVLHQQMAYVPKNMGNVSFILDHASWQLYAQGQYTGNRFSDGNDTKLDSYFLTNGGLIRRLALRKQQLSCSFSVNNIFNVNYQNQRYYAMPGRIFRLSISANLDIL